jgi:hypothetical protein
MKWRLFFFYFGRGVETCGTKASMVTEETTKLSNKQRITNNNNGGRKGFINSEAYLFGGFLGEKLNLGYV